VRGGFLYVSQNSGASWASRASDADRLWGDVASSSDGTRFITFEGGWTGGSWLNGLVWTSGDAGATWTARSAPAGAYSSVASSASGQYLIAGLSATATCVVTSADFGATWTPHQMPDNSIGSNGVAISQDGMRLFSASADGGVYASVDSGSTWVARSPQALPTFWGSVVCSPNGLFVTASAYLSSTSARQAELANIYVSEDGGVTWATRTPSAGPGIGWWHRHAQSANGQRMIAGNNQGILMTTSDAGVSWTFRSLPSSGYNSEGTLASSADGSLFFAVGSSSIFRSP
jgi:hypothetical protein